MAEEYVIVPRGTRNMTHEDIIFLPGTDFHKGYQLEATVHCEDGGAVRDQEVGGGLNHWF